MEEKDNHQSSIRPGSWLLITEIKKEDVPILTHPRHPHFWGHIGALRKKLENDFNPKRVDNSIKKWCEGSKAKMWGRREWERMSLTCPQAFVHRPLRPTMWKCEGHFRNSFFSRLWWYQWLVFSPTASDSQSAGFGFWVRKGRTKGSNSDMVSYVISQKNRRAALSHCTATLYI